MHHSWRSAAADARPSRRGNASSPPPRRCRTTRQEWERLWPPASRHRHRPHDINNTTIPSWARLSGATTSITAASERMCFTTAAGSRPGRRCIGRRPQCRQQPHIASVRKPRFGHGKCCRARAATPVSDLFQASCPERPVEESDLGNTLAMHFGVAMAWPARMYHNE